MRIQVNGVELEYDDSGGDQTALVTLHGGPGMGDRKGAWATFQPLTDRYRLVSYDQRGCGESEGVEPYSHEQYAADLEALRQKLGLGRMVLFGHSYGGFIALEYALRYGQNLRALVLCDTAASNGFKDTSKDRALASGLPMDAERLERLFAGQTTSDQDFRDAFAMIQPLYTVEPDPEAEARRLAAIHFRHQTHNWAFSRNQATYNVVPQLPGITAPVLVAVGRHDWITPLEASQEMHALIPSSELAVFDHSGHAPQNEEPQRFLEVLLDFLARRAV